MAADSARRRGIRVIAVAHRGESVQELAERVDEITWIELGQLGQLVKAFKTRDVRHVLMAGAINKTNMFGKVRPDLKGLAVMGKLLVLHDDDILRAVAAELEKEGITVVNSAAYLPELMAPPGCLSKRRPRKEEQEDIDFGWKVAKELGRLDIGHCVVVRRRTVLAVEAIEGTNETILRGGRLAKEKAVVVKVCKPNQDLRFDLPAVGLDTVNTMIEVNAAVLAIEAGKTLIFDTDEMVSLANAHGIVIFSRESI